MSALEVSLAGIGLRSPVLTASGCFGSGREVARFGSLDHLGAVVCKTVTPNPRQGIDPPRGAETASGMLNAIGLQNPGVDAFRAKDLPWLAERGTPAIASVGGHSVEDYVTCVERLRGAGLVAIELNLSCPNLEDRGFMFALDPARAAEVTSVAVAAADVPILVKLSPDVTDLVAVASAVAEAGAPALSLVNTTLGMAIDVDTRMPKLSTTTGGLSGPAIKPIALRCVWQVHQALPHVPIVGMGGIRTGEDAIEFVLAGATAIAVGTANFVDPRVTAHVAEGIARYLDAHGIESLDAIRGATKQW
ncbi:MAG TPA: dihydroorotate dehydrogenase [Actinomycetota bacterium]